MMMPVDVYEDIKRLNKEYIERSVRFLPDPKRTEELMEIVAWFIDKGNLMRAVDFAKLLKPDLSHERLEAILAELVKQGSYNEAKKVANVYLCRPLSIEELITVFKLNIEKNTKLAEKIAEEIITFYEKANV